MPLLPTLRWVFPFNPHVTPTWVKHKNLTAVPVEVRILLSWQNWCTPAPLSCCLFCLVFGLWSAPVSRPVLTSGCAFGFFLQSLLRGATCDLAWPERHYVNIQYHINAQCVHVYVWLWEIDQLCSHLGNLWGWKVSNGDVQATWGVLMCECALTSVSDQDR